MWENVSDSSMRTKKIKQVLSTTDSSVTGQNRLQK